MTDLLGGDGWKHSERAFFGEESAPVGLPLPPRHPEPRRGTIEQHRQWRIDDGLCPRGSCSGTLDAEQCCTFCGWSRTEEEMRRRTAKKEADAA